MRQLVARPNCEPETSRIGNETILSSSTFYDNTYVMNSNDMGCIKPGEILSRVMYHRVTKDGFGLVIGLLKTYRS
jgi:hypothetical protein